MYISVFQCKNAPWLSRWPNNCRLTGCCKPNRTERSCVPCTQVPSVVTLCITVIHYGNQEIDIGIIQCWCRPHRLYVPSCVCWVCSSVQFYLMCRFMLLPSQSGCRTVRSPVLPDATPWSSYRPHVQFLKGGHIHSGKMGKANVWCKDVCPAM